MGCTHGDHIDPIAADAVIRMRQRWKPQICGHLGDAWDTTAWRSGATGKGDERERTDNDFKAGCDFLTSYGANFFIWGNHDERPARHLKDSNTLVAEKAEHDLARMAEFFKDHKIKTIASWSAYDYFTFANWHFLHSTIFAKNSTSKMASAHAPHSVLFANTHVVGVDKAENMHNPTGMCVGTLTRIRAEGMAYAKSRHRTLAWSQGFAWGEQIGNELQMWLHDNGQNLKKRDWILPV